MRMNQKAILFDQDGTLLDSAPGIKRCAQETLLELGMEPPAYADLDYFIGPPLRDCFRLSNVDEKNIEKAVVIYRKLYADHGKYDASIYPGLISALKQAKEEGFLLFVCTSKNEILAKDILKHFSLDSYFDGVFGSRSDGAKAEKGAIIKRCLGNLGKRCKAIMVGDTHLDAIGAKENDIPCLIVDFGYGNKEKLKQNPPFKAIHSFDEIIGVYKEIYR